MEGLTGIIIVVIIYGIYPLVRKMLEKRGDDSSSVPTPVPAPERPPMDVSQGQQPLAGARSETRHFPQPEKPLQPEVPDWIREVVDLTRSEVKRKTPTSRPVSTTSELKSLIVRPSQESTTGLQTIRPSVGVPLEEAKVTFGTLDRFDLNPDAVTNGIIWSEILQPPLCKRPNKRTFKNLGLPHRLRETGKQ